MLNVEPEALLEVLGEAETRAKKLAESDEYGFIAAADANAENVVHSLYDNIVDGRKEMCIRDSIHPKEKICHNPACYK